MDTDRSRWIRTKIYIKKNIQKDKARRGRLIKIDGKRSVKIEKERTGQTNRDKERSSQVLVEQDRERKVKIGKDKRRQKTR